MHADDLRLEELVEFSEGSISLQGNRLILHSLHAMGQLRADLARMVGMQQTRRILTRFGYFHGQAGAAVMERVFRWDSLEQWLRAGVRLQTLQGAARAVVKALDLGADAFRMEVTWHASGEAEEHLLELGRTEEPICWILTGYVSGYASYCMKRNIYFIERKCRGRGDRICQVVGLDEASWGDELAPHLPYFQPEDIQGKVRELAQELRQKDVELRRHRRHLEQLERLVHPGFAEVRSRAFQQVLELASRIAPFDSPVLITGESGTGKEVLARFIHERSARASGPFVAINCAALPESLLEAELFGHKAGAFTGAAKDRTGLFEEARKGTILLDEIGEMPPPLQAKLLRVLQEKEVLRLGENVPRPIDVRVLAATNRDMDAAVKQGAFREDLFYRLSVVEIRVPPLRDRPEDLLPLARFFVQSLAKKLKLPRLRLDATCLEHLQRYSWPGNIRELQNCLERAAMLSRDGLLLPEGLPPAVREAREPQPAHAGSLQTLEETEREQIQAALRHTGGNRARAARLLGISTSTLWRKLRT